MPTSWWDELDVDGARVELRVRRVAEGVRLVVEVGDTATDVVVPAEVATQLGSALIDAAEDSGTSARDPDGVGRDRDQRSTPPRSTPTDAPDEASLPDAVSEPQVAVGGRLEASSVRPWHTPPPEASEAEQAVAAAAAHLRRLCRVLPEAAEVDALGLPTFRVATRIFAVAEVVEGMPVVRFKVSLGEQEALVADDRFRPDPDTGHHGWTNARADLVGPGAELDELVLASYRLVAPGHAVAALDAALAVSPPADPHG